VRAKHPDVAIVGAGIIGLFCAYFLAQRGLRVVVLERKTPGAGSSTRNGGGVRSQWGTATNIQLSVLSEPYWAEFEERFDADVGLNRIGYLFLAADTNGLHELQRNVELQHQYAVASEILSASEIARRWPSLADLNVAGGSFCATDGFLNQHRLMHAMTRAVEAAGVAIESETDVTGMDVKAGGVALRTTAGVVDTGLVLNCAGAWAPRLAEMIGFTLPIRSRRVSLILTRPTIPLPSDLPWLIDSAHGVHIRQDLNGRAQVGGFLGRDESVDPDDFIHDADPDWIATVQSGVANHLRIEIDQASLIESWAGLYPSTPDQHPIIDRLDTGMVVVGGFAGAGLMHAPAAALLAAELVVDGRIASLDAAPISLARFSGPVQSIEGTGF
jgi:sarcosine oxidase subunit beta